MITVIVKIIGGYLAYLILIGGVMYLIEQFTGTLPYFNIWIAGFIAILLNIFFKKDFFDNIP